MREKEGRHEERKEDRKKVAMWERERETDGRDKERGRDTESNWSERERDIVRVTKDRDTYSEREEER